jgi:hypothetical protein
METRFIDEVRRWEETQLQGRTWISGVRSPFLDRLLLVLPVSLIKYPCFSGMRSHSRRVLCYSSQFVIRRRFSAMQESIMNDKIPLSTHCRVLRLWFGATVFARLLLKPLLAVRNERILAKSILDQYKLYIATLEGKSNQSHGLDKFFAKNTNCLR